MSAKIHIIFNFFEKIGTAGAEAFVNGWKQTTTVILKNPHFLRTQLHRNVNEQGLYKYVNYAQFDSDKFAGFRPDQASPEWKEQMAKGKASNLMAFPGGFFEIATFDDKPITPALPESESSLFIITSYEVGSGVDSSNLEQTWKDWSGSNTLFEKKSAYGFTNSGLYKRFTDHGKFLYVVRTEFTGLSGNMPKGWELVESVRGIKLPDGVSGETSLYQVMADCVLEKSK